jgi:cytohesin
MEHRLAALGAAGVAVILTLVCRPLRTESSGPADGDHRSSHEQPDEEQQDREEAAVRAAEEAGEREAQRQDAAVIKAAGKGDAAELQELLRRGADPDADNQHGWTALHAAATKGHGQCVESLVQGGATVDAEDGGCSTPLMAAARGGHVEVVRMLLEAGADPARKDEIGNRGGRTALNRAKRAGKHEVVALLEGWARQQPRPENLEAAAKAGDLQSLRELLAKGCDPNATNATLWTALHQASQKGHSDCVKVLLENGALVDCKDRVGRTSLMLAAPSSDMIVRLLLKAGADHSCKTRVGDSALHWAASKGNSSSIETLLANGAAPNARNTEGRTPLMQSALYGHSDAVSALLAAGADPAIRDTLGRTALDVALSLGTPAAATLEAWQQQQQQQQQRESSHGAAASAVLSM